MMVGFAVELHDEAEAAVADLNQDGSPEVVFTTYGDPNDDDSGHLVILAADGALLHDLALEDPGTNGNGTKGGKLDYHQIPGWHGKCVPGEEFNASMCNQKLIGAQYYNDPFDPGAPTN
mgnify:CR=1 FL=1